MITEAETLQMLALLVGAVVWAMLLPRLIRLAVDDEAMARIGALFQPRWKREAEFLARHIPDGDAWGDAR
jgi:hypothetical protein